jgi:hypothetical protein
VIINAGTAGEVSFAKDWQIKGVRVTAKDGTQVQVQHSTGVNFK